ncbi:VQ motif-containing protein 25-like [Andrographis paniculata]|uniref:VQ motif-containing protein 25-like n=1 Tax=Andrographis paniculata TaxID=175694 RepID=UPI0021E94226|nr:VQ motif-containing protein 25-like [Andrographis paniculata]
MVPKSFDRDAARFKPLVNHKSHRISKLKPKIRIIHLIEPEIITTDVQNFRELVQRLTGKPDAEINRRAYLRCNNNNASPRGNKPSTSSESERSAERVKTEKEDFCEGEMISDLFLSFLEDSDAFIINGIGMDQFPNLLSEINAFDAELPPLC